jgi:hypothetical protein
MPHPSQWSKLSIGGLSILFWLFLVACGSSISSQNDQLQPDFSLNLSASSLSITAGASQNFSITATSSNGFSKSVNIVLSGLPASVTATPSTLSLIPGVSQKVTLNADASATAGQASITITGTSGSLVHTAALTLNISPAAPGGDFTLSGTPDNLALTAGGAGKQLSVSASSVNGFSDTVKVTFSGLPSGVTVAPSTLNLTPGTPQTVTLSATVTAALGKATVAFTGTSGSLTHTANVSLEVDTPPLSPDFTLSVAPQSLAITDGATGQQVAVSATAQNGFTGTVDVSVSGLPSGVTAAPATLNLSSGTSQNMMLTAAANATTGSTTVTFTGASSSLTHTATLALTVNAAPPPPGVDVTTYHYDNARDGLNANETTLTLNNVNSTSFGKIGFFSVDGKVDAEPLYLSQLTINGEAHNVLYAVTEHDSVYAFDADTGTVLWQISVLQASEKPSDNHGCSQITPEIGITDTPVIDRNLGAIFFVAMTKDASGAYHQRLHALSLATGSEIEGGPTEITASYPGTGEGSKNGVQTFDPGQYAERVGLLLMNGSIFMGWTSHCDINPYTGWLMMYDERTLQQTSVLNLTPNAPATIDHYIDGEGSIWQAGAGLAGDSQGNIYFLDANGAFDTTLNGEGFPSQGNYGNSFMKVSSANNKLTPADYFATYDTVAASIADRDLGSGGVLLLPDMTDANGTTHHLAVGQGKDGNFYIVDRDNMGKFDPAKNNIYQEVDRANTQEFGMPAFFNGTLYYGGMKNVLRAFAFEFAKLNPKWTSQTAVTFPYPGTTPGISANGTQNGIVWALESDPGAAAVLHAYDASDLTRELYNSNQAANGRDSFGLGNKFITPMITNGKVFVGTPNGVAVFGLLH